MKCVTCRYDLSGLRRNVCPECGTPFDPTTPPPRRRYWLAACIISVIVVYAPFGWLFLVQDDPAYVRYWQVRYPILPGLAPLFGISAPFNYAPGRPPAWLVIFIMAVITAAMLAASAWLGSRSRISLVIVSLVALTLSVLNAYFAHIIFAA